MALSEARENAVCICVCLCVCVHAGSGGSQASANAPAVLQCISLINSAALSIHPLRDISHWY